MSAYMLIRHKVPDFTAVSACPPAGATCNEGA